MPLLDGGISLRDGGLLSGEVTGNIVTITDPLFSLLLKSGIPAKFYVGQTESIGKRIQQHRSNTFRDCRISAAVVRAPNTGAARLLETQIIRVLKKEGVPIVNDGDGNKVNFGSL